MNLESIRCSQEQVWRIITRRDCAYALDIHLLYLSVKTCSTDSWGNDCVAMATYYVPESSMHLQCNNHIIHWIISSMNKITSSKTENLKDLSRVDEIRFKENKSFWLSNSLMAGSWFISKNFSLCKGSINTYALFTKREVKMARYWPSSFFAFLFGQGG